MADPIGYSFNNGGLNNQKLALLGLFMAGFQQKRPIVLPLIYNKNVPLEKNSPAPIDNSTIPAIDVFDPKGIEHLAKKYDITIDPSSSMSFEMGGWDYFGLGAGGSSTLALHGDRTEISALVRDFLLNVVPLVRQSYVVSQLKQDIFRRKHRRFFAKGEMIVAAQLRIESDWEFFSAVTLLPIVGNQEDYLISYDRILDKIKKTIPNTRKLLVIYDEAAVSVPKEEVRRVCKQKFDLDLVWKSDFLTPYEMKTFGPLTLSMIDFELALGADKFVGLSRSTFSNMVTLEKFAAKRSRVTTDYIYNNNRAELDLRTDNGGHAEPSLATQKV